MGTRARIGRSEPALIATHIGGLINFGGCGVDGDIRPAPANKEDLAPRQSVGRVARLSGNVRQPNHVLVNEIAGHKAERRPWAGKEWLAATKYDGVEVKSILINKTKVG